MKVIKSIADSVIRQVLTIGESQFGFVLGRGKTDAIFVICQLQEKYFKVGKQMYMFMVIVDLEKAFDRVPQGVIWWAMRKFVLKEWIVNLIQGM